MLKVKMEGKLFVFLMENYKSLVEDIYNGYIYLKCDERMFERIYRHYRYYNR